MFNQEWMPVTGRVFIFGNTKQQGNTNSEQFISHVEKKMV